MSRRTSAIQRIAVARKTIAAPATSHHEIVIATIATASAAALMSGSALGGALHPHPRQMLAERRAADLGVRALQLAARCGDAPGHVVERQRRGELALDDRVRLREEAGAQPDGGRPLCRH